MQTSCAFCARVDGHEAGCPGDFSDAEAADTARLANALGMPTVAPSVKGDVAGADNVSRHETIATEVDGATATVVLNGATGGPLLIEHTPTADEALEMIAKAEEQVQRCEIALKPHTEALKAAKKDLEAAVARGVEVHWKRRQLELGEE